MKTNDIEFNRAIANVIWMKLKGRSVPDSYTDREIADILSRYWHRAMESES
jgi:hypothetical protein